MTSLQIEPKFEMQSQRQKLPKTPVKK